MQALRLVPKHALAFKILKFPDAQELAAHWHLALVIPVPSLVAQQHYVPGTGRNVSKRGASLVSLG